MVVLTKVAKGVAFGDVSNQAVRNILTEISKNLRGPFTEKDMEKTLDFFEGKCPYTNRDLRKSLADKDGTYATDHIYPQNQEWCGLNVIGNLVIVDRKANDKKHNKDVKTFLETDTEVLGPLSKAERDRRLKKIQDFQKACGYDPEQVRKTVSALMQSRYDEIRKQQEACIANAMNELAKAGIYPDLAEIEKKKPKSKKTSAKAGATPKKVTVKTRATAGSKERLVFDILNDIVAKGKMTPALLTDLQDTKFALAQFSLSTYPVLIEAAAAAGHPKYNPKKFYQNRKLTIDSREYYVCSQWSPEIRFTKLQDWHKTF